MVRISHAGNSRLLFARINADGQLVDQGDAFAGFAAGDGCQNGEQQSGKVEANHHRRRH